MADYMHSSSRRKNAVKHVFIAIPTYGDLPAKSVHTLLTAKDWLISHDVSVDVMILAGNCHVDDARNDMVARFMDTDCTDLVFVDSDVVYTPMAIGQLLSHPVDIVGGAYPYKDKPDEFPIVFIDNQWKAENGLVEVAGIPTGFLRISRAAVTAAYKMNYPKGTWKPKGLNTAKNPNVEMFYRGFKPIEGAQPGEATFVRRSGDFQFCHDMRRAGWSIYCDPNLSLGHIGQQHSLGNLGRKLMEPKFHEILPPYVQSLAHAESEVAQEAVQFLADAFGNKPWAAGPQLLGSLWGLARNPEVKSILEAGSGISSVIMQAVGKVPVSLEADYGWLAKTASFLRQCGLTDKGLYHAPVKETQWGTWYDYQEKGLRPDLIFIDGPVRTAAGVRAIIMDVLPNAVRGAKFVVVDDVDDGDGAATVARLEKEFGFKATVIPDPTRRAYAVLRKV